MANNANQQFIIGQQYNNRAGTQNYPGVAMQNVQMIGANDNNMIMYNQNAGSNENSRRDLNQRIFQNQGRAYQLQ